MQHRHRQLQPLLDSERQAVRPRVLDRFEFVTLEKLLDPNRTLPRRQVVELRVQFEVLQHRQLAVEREGLRHVSDVPARLHVVVAHGMAEQLRAPFRDRKETREHLHRGGLAAAVRTEEAEDLAAGDAEADVVDGGEAAEAPGQVLGLDRRNGVEPGRPGLQHHGPVLGLLLGWKEGDECGLHIGLGRPLQQLGRTAARDDVAVIHRDQPLEARGLVHVGGGDDHAHAGPPGPDRADQLPELPARERIDARGRLVEDQQVGIVDERAAQAELLLHPARQLARRALLERVEAGRGEKVGDAPSALRRPLAEQAAVEVDVLEHAQRRVEVAAETLRHVGDARRLPRAVAPLGHVAAEHRHAAGLNPAHAGHEREQGRLADAVRPDDSDHAAGGKIERHVVEGARPAVAMRDVLQPGDDGRVAHAALTAASRRGRPARGRRPSCARNPSRARPS